MSNIELRDYQIDGVQGIREEFKKKNDPVLFVLSAGGGKTYTFCYIADNAAKRVNPADKEYIFIVVHRKELLIQASESLRKLDIDHGLISPHFTPAPHRVIQVASIDTLLIRIRKHPMKARMLIFDEAHHVVQDNKWGRLYEALGMPSTLGVTATPVRSDGKGLGEHAGGIFKSMVKGPSLSELLDKNCLVNPIVYTSIETPDLSGLKPNKEGHYQTKALEDRVDKPKITGCAVEQYSKVCPGLKTIVFCVSIAHAKHVVAEFNAAGWRFALLVGEPHMKDSERTAVNEAIRNGALHGVCTVDLVGEGYDVPSISCVIMLRPTASESLFIQQAWRAGRPEPKINKQVWYLLDHVGNVGRVIDGVFVPKHGLPQIDRIWTLDGKEKGKGKKKEEEKAIALLQCPACFIVHEPAAICPSCGHVYQVKERKIEQVDGELVRISDELNAEAMRLNNRREVGRAQSLEELQKIEQERGYKRGWARAVFESRQRKQQPARRKIPEPSMEELKKMSLAGLQKVASQQGWPYEWSLSFYNTTGLGSINGTDNL